MKTIKLSCFDIVVTLTGDGGGTITSDLGVEAKDPADEKYNAAMDGIESMVLGHAIAGIDIESPAYIEGIETAVQSCANNF